MIKSSQIAIAHITSVNTFVCERFLQIAQFVNPPIVMYISYTELISWQCKKKGSINGSTKVEQTIENIFMDKYIDCKYQCPKTQAVLKPSY
jgi:hypothetical protein